MTRQRSRAFNAVLEHHRCWVSSDGACFNLVRSAGLTPAIAYTIAQDYGVARTIGKRDRVASLAVEISSITDSAWKVSLADREDLCRGLGKAHKKGATGKKRHLPISGISKLMWFLRPDGWTMYDSFARKGLVGASKGAPDFYKKLDQCGFVECAAAITKECRALGLPLFGERVIDKFLMLRGMDNAAYDWTAALANSHFAWMPNERQEQLEGLGGFVEGMDLEERFPAPIARARRPKNQSATITAGTTA